MVTVCKMAISLLMTPFLIHVLGNEAYGLWTLVVSFSVSGFLSIFSLGIQAALVMAVAEHHARGETDAINVVFTAALSAYSLIGLIAAGTLFAFTHTFFGLLFQIPPHLLSTARILLGIIALQAVVDLPCLALDAIVTGLQRFDVGGLLELIRSLAFAGTVVALVLEGRGVVSLVLALLGASVVNVGLYGIAAKRLLPSLRLTRDFKWPLILQVARTSVKMLLLRLNAIVYGQMDKVILGILLTTTVLTDYDVASRFHSLALVAMGFISSVVLPTASAQRAVNDHAGLKRLFLTGTKFSAALALPLSIMLIVMARDLLRLWIGPDFVRDSGLVYLFLSYTVFWVLLNVGWNIMVGIGLATEILKIQVVTTVLNLAVSILCTLWVGTAGVLWGTLIGNLVAAALYLRLILPRLEVSVLEFLKKVVLPVYPLVLLLGAGFYVTVHVRPPRSLVHAGCYCVAFLAVFAVLFLIAGLTRRERSALRSLSLSYLEQVGGGLPRISALSRAARMGRTR